MHITAQLRVPTTACGSETKEKKIDNDVSDLED